MQRYGQLVRCQMLLPLLLPLLQASAQECHEGCRCCCLRQPYAAAVAEG
jgi:hypothetical protein